MKNFLDNLHQGGKYSAQIAIHQEELKRERKITDQKYLSISSPLTDYLNIDGSSRYSTNNERVDIVYTKCTFFGGANHSSEKCFKRTIKDKEKARAAGDLYKQRTERTP